VFWADASRLLHMTTLDHGVVSTTSLPGMTVEGNPFAVSTSLGTDVFWRNTAGQLWMGQVTSWGWGPAQQLAGGIASDPTPVSDSGGNPAVFWRGYDGMLWQLNVGGTSAGQASTVSGQLTNGQPAAATASLSLTLVTRSATGNLTVLMMVPGAGWVGPELLGLQSVASDPILVASGDAMSVFWTASGALWTSAACSGCELTPQSVVLPLP